MTDRAASPLERRRSLHISRRGLADSAVAALAARRGWEARAQDSPAGVYEGANVDTIFGQA